MSIIEKIKNLFRRKSNKQLPERKESKNDENKLRGIKVTPLSEMSNDEINKIMEQMEKNPWGPQQYEDEQLLEEIFKRVGADEELAKMSAENNVVNQVWACHRTGRLVTQEDGTTEYYDEYINEKGSYRTTIGCEDGVVTVDNKQYLDKDGNDVNIPEYYDYYTGDMDARFTNQVRISKNDFGGITLENDERDRAEKFNPTTIIEFDSNNIQMKKTRQPFKDATTILERTKNPFILKETYVGGTSAPIISYASVTASAPDKLYSLFNSNDSCEEYPEAVVTISLSDIDMEKLKRRNPKAAKYFAALGRDEKGKGVAGEE